MRHARVTAASVGGLTAPRKKIWKRRPTCVWASVGVVALIPWTSTTCYHTLNLRAIHKPAPWVPATTPRCSRQVPQPPSCPPQLDRRKKRKACSVDRIEGKGRAQRVWRTQKSVRNCESARDGRLWNWHDIHSHTQLKCSSWRRCCTATVIIVNLTAVGVDVEVLSLKRRW